METAQRWKNLSKGPDTLTWIQLLFFPPFNGNTCKSQKYLVEFFCPKKTVMETQLTEAFPPSLRVRLLFEVCLHEEDIKRVCNAAHIRNSHMRRFGARGGVYLRL